tara:strand:- start:219 stop:491 length:273 start_codon:yes stop_codon:yes gene_type:complete
MKYAKIEKGVVVQTQPNNEAGFIEVADNVVCTQIQKDNLFVNPPIIPLTYAELRATAYPPITDQLDTIYHEGIDAWKAVITAVKEEYPKP